MKQASKEFLAVLSMAGCLVSDCACGRTHFATNREGQGHYDEGELQRLYKMKEKEPNLYVEYPDCDAVHVAIFRGCNYVVDCECGKLAALERTLWDVKDLLLQYYRLRIDKEKAEAAQSEGLLESLTA